MVAIGYIRGQLADHYHRNTVSYSLLNTNLFVIPLCFHSNFWSGSISHKWISMLAPDLQEIAASRQCNYRWRITVRLVDTSKMNFQRLYPTRCKLRLYKDLLWKRKKWGKAQACLCGKKLAFQSHGPASTPTVWCFGQVSSNLCMVDRNWKNQSYI